LLITSALVRSAVAQDNSGAQLTQSTAASLPRQQLNSTPTPTAPSPVFGGTEAYPPQMQGVLEALSEELGLIAQAVHDGKITRAQAEYLSVERYYTALMRLQLLRTLRQNQDEPNQSESYAPASTAPQVSGDTVVIPPPTSSSDILPRMADYLGLNPAQIAKIQRQISVDRQEVRPLLERLEKTRRELISATLDGRCDVRKIQALAEKESRILKQLIVANALLEAKVYSMLTTEQQHKVDELRRQGLASLKVSFPDGGQE
jgi:Spy/CpxP family protein refolding chaperone